MTPLHDETAKWRMARYLRSLAPKIAGDNRGICEAVIVRYQTPWAENLASDIKDVFDTIGWKYHEVFAKSTLPKDYLYSRVMKILSVGNYKVDVPCHDLAIHPALRTRQPSRKSTRELR